ncbi:hypothetical protein [Streptomyces sp. cg36]|uniref:hypothetical protein n=1 Tax=Streptomyces sp. cg36 TaxID=3238798 RepID=UPI0034E2D945
MAVEADTQQGRVTGRVWTVRLAPYGRPSAGTVRLSCSRPACADQRFTTAAQARKGAVEHVNGHLAHVRSGGGPRGDVWCACRAADCAWHTPDTLDGHRGGARPAAAAVRCGGPVVLTVHADRAGRLWRIAETCARCAAATGDCRVLDTAPPPPRTAPAGPAPDKAAPQGGPAGRAAEPSGPVGGATAVFSDHTPVTATPSSPPTVPAARTTSPGDASPQPQQEGKIAQRAVPHDLRPDSLRVELIELGDEFRAYQQRTAPDLSLLADLHDRKAVAFAQWADVTGDGSLRREAHRARKAAQTTREMHENRCGGPGGAAASGDGPPVERLLTRGQAAHARTVLDHVPGLAPSNEAAVHLAVLMLTLRCARTGTGNITGQDLTGWLQEDAERVVEQLVAADWLRLPGTVEEALASRPEDPAAVVVPSLLPDEPCPFAFGKTTRSRISGWAQKASGDRRLRKRKPAAPARLLALYTAAHIRPDGRLGEAGDSAGDGLGLERMSAFCAVPTEELAEHAALLIAADWLTEADVDVEAGTLRGRLAERVWPLGGLL